MTGHGTAPSDGPRQQASWEKSRQSFEFDANPNIDPATIHALASCERIKKSEPFCLLGDSGTGKSHMLIALGAEAAIKGYRFRHTPATKLVNELVEAPRTGSS
ncbi:Insertion sequence IS5376 putative ATP-binding protein [Streptomyces sp. RO-S4]|nr:Insertion sequence IS5376 putative ATP-binding protein [Streptomyces sp. RO-S4]